jgi:UDP-glucose 4-epimerase
MTMEGLCSLYYKNKNILITGGLGFLGSNLAHLLVKKGAVVTLIDNLNPLYGGNFFNINGIEDKVKLIINDVRNQEIITELIKSTEIIFHFAAQVSYIDSLSMPHEDLSINAESTLQILELCRKHNPKAKIVFASSRMVLGKIETDLMTEDTPTNPLSLYGIHKLTSEKYLAMYYKDFGIPYVVLRITNPYGNRQQIKHNKYSLVGWFIRQAMEEKTINIFGKGEQLRDYIFVSDIVEAFARCGAENEAIGQTINIGSGISAQFNEMVNSVVDVVGKGNVAYIPWPTDYERIETGDVRTDISRLRKVTNWKPKYSLIQGIEATYEYYKKHIKYYI